MSELDYLRPPIDTLDSGRSTRLQNAVAGATAKRTTSRSSSTERIMETLDLTTKINLSDIPWDYAQSATSDPETNVRIGITSLNIPPSSIQVTEDKYNEEVPVLRGRGAALIKTGRGHIRIEMPLEFPTASAINDNLRELIAQFRVCPFTTIENYRVAASVTAGRLDRLGAATIQEGIDKAEEEKERALDLYSHSRQQVMDIVRDGLDRSVRQYARVGAPAGRFESAFGASYSTLLEQIIGYSPDELNEWCLGTFTKGINSVPLGDVKGARFFLDLNNKLKERLQEMLEAVKTVNDRIRNLAELSIAQSMTAPVVPAAFRQLVCQTVPGSIDRLQGHLEMWYFNSQVYAPILSFVGVNGSPTQDIAQCQVYRDHVSRFLSSSGVCSYDDHFVNNPIPKYESQSQLLLIEYPTTGLVEVDSPKPVPNASMGSKQPKEETPKKIYKPVNKTFQVSDVGPNSQKIIVKNIAVSLQNNLAPQPVEGALYGTLQYMGTMNAKIKITISIHGDSEEDVVAQLTKVQDIKVQTDAVSQLHGQRSRRNARIRIENSIINMFGVHNVLLDRVVSRTAGPFTQEVDLFFTEYTTNIEKRERVFLMSDLSDSTNDITLKYLINLVAAYYHGNASKEAMDFVANMGSLGNDGILWARDILYGNGDKDGIVSPEIIKEVYKLSNFATDMYNSLEVPASSAFVAKPDKVDLDLFGAEMRLIDKYTSAGNPIKDIEAALNEAEIEKQRSRVNDMGTALDDAATKSLRIWRGDIQIAASRANQDKTTNNNKVLKHRASVGISGYVDLYHMPDQATIVRIQALLRTPQFSAEQSRLVSAMLEARKIFPALNERIKEIQDALDPSSYPDLQLPDYFTAFKPLWAFIKTKTGIDITSSSYKDLNSLPDRVKDAVRIVVPTYSDLGVLPPYGRKTEDFARTMRDPVEPDFYFFWTKQKNREGFHKGLQAARKAIAEAGTTRRTDPTKVAPDIAGAKRTVAGGLPPGTHLPTNKYSATPTLLEEVPATSPQLTQLDDGTIVPSSNIGGVGDAYLYKPANVDLEKGLSTINPFDKQFRDALMQSVYDEMQDRFQRFITAFPAFRVSLIETDGENLGLYDDWYGYNSIKSIRIHSHKITPKIAEVEIVNVSGNLDEANMLMSDTERDAYERMLAQGTEKGTGEVKNINHFFLEAGTPIVIKLGYASKESELETRFEGQIVSLTSGDVVKIVAQGYAAELTKPLNKVIPGRNFAVIVQTIMDDSGTPHYGDSMLNPWATRDNLIENTVTGRRITAPENIARGLEQLEKIETGRLSDESTGYLRGLRKWILEATHLVERGVGHVRATRKTFNVFLPKERHLSGMLRASDTNWWGTPLTKPWGIPNMDGLSALHEITRYLPGHICTTRSYGRNGVTLFFGKPEQPYFYTDMKQDEEAEWVTAKDAAKATAQDKTEQLFLRFFESEWGKHFQEMLVETKGATFGGTAVRVWTDAWRWFVGTPVGLLRLVTLGGVKQAEYVTNQNLGEWVSSFVHDTRNPDWHQEATPSQTEELNSIKAKVNTEGLRKIAALFFAKYNDTITYRGMLTSEGVRTFLNVLSYSADFLQEGVGMPFRATRDLDTPDGRTINAGVMLYWYGGWENALNTISGQIGSPGGSVPQDQMSNVVSDAFPEYSIADATIPMYENGGAISRENFTPHVRSIINWIPQWKRFLWCFGAFLREDESQDLLSTVAAANKKQTGLKLNPRMRRLRRHHFASSYADIIKNNIQATREFMANHVVVAYPNSESMKQQGENFVAYVGAGKESSVQLGYSDDIEPSEHVVRVITEHNAVTDYHAKVCAKSNLAEALRPMYRGELLLRGHERINPYDIVWINDWYNNVFGPIEVESVTDHLDDTGYYVSIVPHATVINNSSSTWADATAVGSFWYEGSTAMLSGIAGSLALGIVSMGVLAPAGFIAGAGGRVAARDSYLRRQSGTGYYEQLSDKVVAYIVGQGMYNTNDPGIRLIPLVRRGKPWTAGLRGIGFGGWKARLERSWKQLKTGWSLFWEGVW